VQILKNFSSCCCHFHRVECLHLVVLETSSASATATPTMMMMMMMMTQLPLLHLSVFV